MFSKGNMYSESNHFFFHPVQYAFLGDENDYQTDGQVDLFAWGSSGFIFNESKPLTQGYYVNGETQLFGQTWNGWVADQTLHSEPTPSGDWADWTAVAHYDDGNIDGYWYIRQFDHIWLYEYAKDSLYGYVTDGWDGVTNTTGPSYFTNQSTAQYATELASYYPFIWRGGNMPYRADMYDKFKYLHTGTCPRSTELNATTQDAIYEFNEYSELGINSSLTDLLDVNTGYGPSSLVPAFQGADNKVEGMHALWGGAMPYHFNYESAYATKNFDWGVYNKGDFGGEEWRTLRNEFYKCSNFKSEAKNLF